MEAQLQRPSHDHHHYEEDPQNAGLHSVIEGEEQNHHGEKKSVLKKVKDKAKKIKDTIKKRGHDDQEQEYRHDQVSEEEEDEDEEMVNHPEVHGAPMYASTVIRNTDLPIQTGVNLEKPTDTRKDRYNPNVRDDVYPNVVDEGVMRPSAVAKMEFESERPPMERREPKDKSPFRSSPNVIDVEEAHVVEPMVKIGPLLDLEEDPHSPKNRPGGISPSNYQAKVVDPTGEGGKEVEVAPLVRRVDNLNVHDESESNPEPKSCTGSHDQFAPQPIPTKDQFKPESNPVGHSENPEQAPKSSDPAKPGSMPRDTIAGKITSATYLIADKAAAAKNVVASKIGYGGQTQEGQDSSKKPVSESATEYGHTVAEKLTSVYEKAAGAGTATLSKVQRGGGGAELEGEDTVAKGTDKGVSMKEYLAEKFRPGDEDKALSEAITDAFHKKKEGLRGTGEEQPMGQVTESPEVAARLGTGRENKREGEDALAAGSESSGAGVVDRLKGAVSSWLGKSTGMETARQSLGQSYVSDATGGAGQSKEEVSSQQPRQQESGN